uniref:Structural maintenance of chromosomes protein 6 n=1 Tax=Oreochromis niloticus TaxID=8128 RepID=A0A669BWC5_ORENI
MSKRKGTSVSENPNKRSRSVNESENAADSDQEDPILSNVRLPLSDAGIVESITLKNFMCHSLLGPFTFGSNVNFVVGNNGSKCGKSAVLTALIVALGGNAQATNRGSSLRGFVKEGESSADVSITLRNKGRDAYKPEVYGSAIILDLRITREGLRTYKLRSKSGQLISTKKEELVSILDNFNIQVNNPVSVLTQEMSKYFLHSKGEGDKYKFFMKATQLEQMREDFIYIKTTKHLTEDKVEQHSECLKDLKRKYLEKEDRYRSLASLDEMHTKLEELQKQMAWALEKLQVDEAEKKYKQVQEQLERITQQVQELQPKCAELKTEAQKRNNLLKSSEVRVECKANLRDLEKDKTQLMSRIKDLKLSISQKTGAESKARAERIEQIQTELENLKHQISTLGQQIDQYHHAIKQEVLQRSIEANRRNLQTMESSRSNRLRRFGEQMPALLNAIQEAHRRGQFKHRPRGPLGYLISLKDPELALAVEVCLKGQLLAFTCDNYEDEKVLQGLMARMFQGGRRPAIITSNFLSQVHDTRKKAVNHPNYPSVLQALEIEDPVVANCLIDQKGIESILLIKNRTEARRVMQSKSPPANCIHAFSKDGDQIFTNRSYAAEQTRANYLSGDVEEEIRYMSDLELENQKAQATRFQQQMRKLDDDVKQNEGLLRRAHQDQKTIKMSVAKAKEICLERVESRRSARTLDSEISRLKLKITSQKEQQGDREEIVRQYHEALESYKNMTQQMKNLNSFIKSLDSVMSHRLQAYAELRRFLSARCKYYFDSMLAQRGYSGSMIFDHKNETLSISVQPGQGNKADLSDMRSLSGGERSFSTVCFVLSLWAITEAPFRCLDEFDVYMDMVNRRISMDMMLKVAASQRYRQFIFLTPQNMSSLPESKIIRILRLKDPDRGQRNTQRGEDGDQ